MVGADSRSLPDMVTLPSLYPIYLPSKSFDLCTVKTVSLEEWVF